MGHAGRTVVARLHRSRCRVSGALLQQIPPNAVRVRARARALCDGRGREGAAAGARDGIQAAAGQRGREGREKENHVWDEIRVHASVW